MARRADILSQLDRAAADYTCPDVGHGYHRAIDARLHVFGDADRWALVVELVGYNPRAGDVVDVRHVFGNCLTRGLPGTDNDDFFGRIDNMDEIEVEDGERFRGGVPVVRGVAVQVSGVEGDELRRRIPSDLPEILTLDEWHQPRAV